MSINKRSLQSDIIDLDPESIDFSDIGWVMDCIDVESVLDRLNVNIESRRGDQIWGYCPDHELFTGKEPSHPKWTINASTGKTNCFTEGRGSNIVYIVARLKKMSHYRALEWILGHSANSVEAKYSRIKRLIGGSDPIKQASAFRINDFKKYFDNKEIQSGSIALLARNNILPKTALEFDCVEFTNGFYKDRMVFPVKDYVGKLVGFVATDVLGKKDWLKENPTLVDRKTRELRKSTEDDYKKVLYPYGFSVGKYLIGENKFGDSKTAILCEGCREVMKLHQEGFTGALGLGGTYFSDEQLLKLTKLHPKKVIIMMDGDSAGRNAEEKIAKKCVRFFQDVYVTRVTWGTDPKDHSREEILSFMRNNTKQFFSETRGLL
jgi:5S rRNA maturation endonuclease (ribonuclease M5)